MSKSKHANAVASPTNAARSSRSGNRGHPDESGDPSWVAFVLQAIRRRHERTGQSAWGKRHSGDTAQCTTAAAACWSVSALPPKAGINGGAVVALQWRADSGRCPRVCRNLRQSPWQNQVSEEQEKVSRGSDGPFPL